ncbi:1,3-beta-glucanosyltransferase GAS1 [Ascoidea rubescens DSM 1968]|uniref:1,3-beta-glucanosyltransferase n=1 Tax=Ascoidea rubescens DSM 1968 TaxID=1344418 RepID=A0A1D2VF13_9ASCO|nr:carbohydrate-binding module family 43 protein [Ascoidea rubescens DSM 1968]ODV60110.1 carbohydrate-binding module family 43 protein [Ascoidea rubescens DSM 1968]
MLTGLTLAELPEISIYGNKFFYPNGSQFLMKGIAYQADTANITTGQTIIDPLADVDVCKRDIPYLEELGTNVIRVYAVNTTLDHDECMSLLDEAGIYVIADLSEPGVSVDRSNPSWNIELFERYKAVVDQLSGYSNVLGYFAGNEVTNDNTNTDASAFVKAAVRDTKAYIKSAGYREIPVGYSSNDDADTRVQIANYFLCGDEDEKSDFYGINMYEWCGSSSFKESGYSDRTDEFKNLSVPIFFSEYGCNEVTPRKFEEVPTIYGEDMTDIWSGGIVYMYFEETNNYGLVTIKNDKVSTLSDFNNLKSQIDDLTMVTYKSSEYTPTSVELSCPTQDSNWKANTQIPPTPDQDTCDCMSKSLSCVVSEDVDESDYEELFDYVCGQIACDGVTGNGTTGQYGSYSFCSAKEKLSFILNLYYVENDKSKSACLFDGSASINSDATTESGCKSILSAAGTDGLGTISASSKTSTARSSRSNSGDSTATNASASESASSSNEAVILLPFKKQSLAEMTITGLLMLCFVAGMGLVVF